MNAEQKIQELAESIGEVVESMAAVKGPAFTNAVLGLFESFQVVEIISMLATAEMTEEQRTDLAFRASGILGSVVGRLTAGMSQEDHAEVEKSAEMLDRRCEGVQRAIWSGGKH